MHVSNLLYMLLVWQYFDEKRENIFREILLLKAYDLLFIKYLLDVWFVWRWDPNHESNPNFILYHKPYHCLYIVSIWYQNLWIKIEIHLHLHHHSSSFSFWFLVLKRRKERTRKRLKKEKFIFIIQINGSSNSISSSVSPNHRWLSWSAAWHGSMLLHMAGSRIYTSTHTIMKSVHFIHLFSSKWQLCWDVKLD